MVWLLPLLIWLILFGLTRLAFRRGRLKSPWHRDVVGLGLLALAALGFFWRVVVGQNWMPADGGDLVSFLYPDLPFCGGDPAPGCVAALEPVRSTAARRTSATSRPGFLYPPNLLLFLLKPDFPYAALQWLSIGHIWFAGAGMYLLLARGLRAAPRGRAGRRTGVHVLRCVPDALRQPELQRGGELAAVGVLGVCWKLEAGSWKLELETGTGRHS